MHLGFVQSEQFGPIWSVTMPVNAVYLLYVLSQPDVHMSKCGKDEQACYSQLVHSPSAGCMHKTGNTEEWPVLASLYSFMSIESRVTTTMSLC